MCTVLYQYSWAIAFLECLESVQSHFADITIPVLTLHGDDDDVCPLVGSERMHASLSSAVKELKVFISFLALCNS